MERRRALCTLAGSGLIAAALAACGTDGDSDSSQNNDSPAKESDKGAVLAAASEIAVGEGVFARLNSAPVVVVQPEEGVYRAFSAICTHQQATVNLPKEGVITCPNHFSEFSDEDGAVLKGPATEPLPEIDVEISEGNVVVA